MSSDGKSLAREQLHKAQAFHRAGQFGLARSHYERAAKLDPGNADTWHLLGVATLQTGNAALAVKHLRTSIKIQPTFAEAQHSLGLAYRALGRNREAINAFLAALSARRGYVDAAFNLGVEFEAAGAPAEAESAYRKALELRVNHAQSALNLGNLLRVQGRLAEALPWLEAALRLEPDSAGANGGVALAMSELGRYAEVIRLARAAASLEPLQATWWKTLGVAQRLLHAIEAAIPNLRRALELQSDDATVGLELALALIEAGEVDEAKELLASSCVPAGHAERVRWLRALLLPTIYRDDADIDSARAQFAAGLEELHAGLDLESPSAIEQALSAVSSVAPFYLHYQPRDNTQLQTRFAELVARVMARAAAQLVEKCSWQPRAHGGRVRVGFVSSHLMQHTVSRYFTALITGLDPKQFDVRVWYGGSIEDTSTRFIAAKVAAFVRTRGDTLILAREIREAQLDVLVYPEIGMDPRHQVLAALRLAPVQCALYGHPVTSGTQTIDYFLSGEALEPVDGQRHYRERMIRFPGLGTQPLPPPSPGSGAWFDEYENGAPLLLCLQNFIKLAPEFDDVLARIAAEAGARIGFFTRNPPLMRRFRARIAQAFAARNLDPDKMLVFLPAQSHADYLAGIARARLVLDSPWFSGGGTSLDALSVGTPVLAWDGVMARGRQTAGMLRMLGVEELIASDADDFVSKAAALVRDDALVARLRKRILQQKSVLFDEDAAVAAFAKFLLQLG